MRIRGVGGEAPFKLSKAQFQGLDKTDIDT